MINFSDHFTKHLITKIKKEYNLLKGHMENHQGISNHLQLSVSEFKSAMKVFTGKNVILGHALLAFEGGFLSIESDDTTAVMHATGEWHGRATFSSQVLHAIAKVPPTQNPLQITYKDNHLLIGTIKFVCQWQLLSQALISTLENPSLIELLALERTIPRSELKGSALGQKIRRAVVRADQRIKKAASHLADLDISETDVRRLVESRIEEHFND